MGQGISLALGGGGYSMHKLCQSLTLCAMDCVGGKDKEDTGVRYQWTVVPMLISYGQNKRHHASLRQLFGKALVA